MARLGDRPRPVEGAQRQAAVVEARHRASASGSAASTCGPTRSASRRSGTLGHGKPDAACLKPAARCRPIAYPKPDGKLTFDRLSSVFLSNTNHEEDQPVHLIVADPDLQKRSELEIFAGPSDPLLPGRRLRMDQEGDIGPRYVINAQNCVHCKTCDIKDPNGNITWVAPEGRRRPELPEHVMSAGSEGREPRDDIAETLRKRHDIAIQRARPAIEVDGMAAEPPCGRLANRSFSQIGRQLAAYRLVSGSRALWIQRLRDRRRSGSPISIVPIFGEQAPVKILLAPCCHHDRSHHRLGRPPGAGGAAARHAARHHPHHAVRQLPRGAPGQSGARRRRRLGLLPGCAAHRSSAIRNSWNSPSTPCSPTATSTKRCGSPSA